MIDLRGKFFNKPVVELTLSNVYVSPNNNIKRVQKDLVTIGEGVLTKDSLRQILRQKNHKIVGLLKCNPKTSIEHISNDQVNYDFFTELFNLADIEWDDTPNFLSGFNELIVIQKYLGGKTKRNNHKKNTTRKK